MRNLSSYTIVAKTWSVAFFIAGLLFLIFPAQLGQSLTHFANSIGLNGTILVPTGSLWYILTLSLMGTLVLLARTTARYPERQAPYVTILSAKTISVAGFLVLSITNGPAWLLCALTDAFVAITLFITHSSVVSKKLVKGFARIHPAKSPHYEVWFGKIDISPGRAFWFRYTIINGVKKEASAWAILFDHEKSEQSGAPPEYSGGVAVGKQTWPLGDLAPSNCIIIPDNKNTERFQDLPQVFHLGSAHLDGANAIGQANDISWDLEFTANGHRFEHVPPLVKFLRVAKSTYDACFLDLRFSGTVKVGSEIITLKDRPGMIGHIYGKKSAHSWAWAHCNNFEGQENVVFEGLSARIKLAGKVTKPLSSFILIVGERRYVFSSTIKLLTAQSAFGDGRWEFMVKNSKVMLKGTATAPQKVALVEYTDTDNSNLWCYNSKMAALKLELTDLKTKKVEVFESVATAAFEIVNRELPSQRVDL
ncbi:MAG: hypothetical protein FVQ77_12215 [Cytophagales bacterium]|nr:hypothetical protein [Cytophagales bacterium]